MNRASWFLLALAVAMLASLTGVWRSSRSRSPQTLLASAHERMQPPHPDYAAAMHELDLALQLARQQGDTEAARSALTYRAELLEREGAHGQAAADYESLLADYRPGDLALMAKLGRAWLSLGELERARDLCRGMLAQSPDYAEGRTLESQVLFEEGRLRLEQVRKLLDDELPKETAERGASLSDRIAALEPSDPLRAALLHDLGELFPVDSANAAERTMELVLEAGERWRSARSGFAQSFKNEVRPAAVYGFLDILHRSGRLSDAVDFGLAGRVRPGALDSKSLQILALALSGNGRHSAASKMIDESETADLDLPLDFRLRLCRILYEARLWTKLLDVAGHMRSVPPGEDSKRIYSYCDFYQGIALIQIKNFVTGQQLLENYIGGGHHEPVDGALGFAFIHLAMAERSAKRPTQERANLEAGLALLPRADGDVWLRLGELEIEAKDPLSNVERCFAQAMCLMPGRMEELRPRWEEYGRGALVEAQRDIELEWENLRREGRWYPARDSGPYELYRLALKHREQGEYSGSSETCEALLKTWPNFLPAFELLIEVKLDSKKTGEAVDLMLERLSFAGADSKTQKALRKIDPAQLNSRQVLGLMKSDPRHTGLLTLARALHERGQGEKALAGLAFVGFDELGDEGRLLAGRILSKLARYDEAETTLAGIKPSSPEIHEALRLRLHNALVSADGARLAGTMGSLRTLEHLDGALMLDAARELQDHGRKSEARGLLSLLDSSPLTRNADVLRELAQAHWLLGDADEARVSIERLRAFSEQGEADEALLLLAVHGREWSQLSSSVAALKATRFVPSELQKTVLAALAEHLDEARGLAEAGLAKAPGDPLWAIAFACVQRLRLATIPSTENLGPRGHEDVLRLLGSECGQDPRDWLALLLALEDGNWRRWARSETGQLDPARCGPLVLYLDALALERLGQHARASTRLRFLIGERPLLPAAWDLWLALEGEQVGPEQADQLMALRARRRAVLGPRPGEEPEQLLERARKLNAGGQAETALACLRECSSSHQDFAPGHLELARALTKRDELGAAVAAWRLYVARAQPSELRQHAGEYLAVLARAGEGADLSAGARAAELEALAVRLPEDPAVALAQAEAEVAAIPQAPAIGVGRAFARLREFRRRLPGRPLNALRPDAARAWFDFYLRLDPLRAELFAGEELELEPGELELWLMLGEALQAQGLREQALLQYEIARSMIPDARILRHIATLVADLGTDHSRVESMLERARKLDNESAFDLGLLFTRARSLVNSGPGVLDSGLAILAELWARRDQAPWLVAPEQIAQRYGTSLLHRNRPEDREQAALALEAALPAITDPVRRDLVAALAYFARAPQPEPVLPER